MDGGNRRMKQLGKLCLEAVFESNCAVEHKMLRRRIFAVNCEISEAEELVSCRGFCVGKRPLKLAV